MLFKFLILIVFSAPILQGQNFHGSEKVFTECCGEDSYIVYEYDLNYISGIECGNWTFDVDFFIFSPDGCIDLIHDVKWVENSTNHQVEGNHVSFYVTSTYTIINLQFEVHVNGCFPAEYFDIPIAITQPSDCPGCTSRINYCETFPCSSYSLPLEYSHDLVWVKMIDAFGNCFDINANNNYGVFTFPYVLHTPLGCDFNLPNLYDFVDDLNVFLEPDYSHIGHAFINYYNTPGECKIKIEIVGSDLTMDKWISKGYNVEDCKRTLICGLVRPLAEFKTCYTTPDYCSLNGQSVNENDNKIHKFNKKSILGNFEINIYPTIVVDDLRINLFSKDNSDYDLSMINTSGQIKAKYKMQKGNYLFSLSLANLEEGLYFAKVKSKNTGMVKIVKFIKQ